MKKLIVSLVLVIFVLSACTWFKTDPKKAVNEGLVNFAEVKTMTSSLAVKGVTKALPGEKPEKVGFTLNITGQSDNSDKQSAKTDSIWKVDLSIDDQKGAAELAVKMLDKKIFLNVSKFEIGGETGEALKTQLAPMLNNWWTIPVSDENILGKFTEEQSKLKEIITQTQFFANATEDGEEEINGMKTIKYRVEIDKQALKKFFLEFASVADNKLTPEEEVAMDESLKEVDFSGVVWIGDDDIIHKVKGTITSQPKQGPVSSFEVDYTAWDFDKDISIVTPDGAKDFNPLMLLPLIGAFGAQDQAAGDANAVQGGTQSVDDKPLGSAQVKKPAAK